MPRTKIRIGAATARIGAATTRISAATARISAALVAASLAGAAYAAEPRLDDATRRKLDENFATCLRKEKGPYTLNYCVCKDGKRKPVWVDGKIVTPCGGSPRFCAAYREPWAEALADEGMYIANLFARDLFLWDKFPDHHDLVRGYVLEKFFIDTHPEHKLAKMRAYGGLAGAEYEARDAPRFFERYLDSARFDQPRHFLLAFELQRRFFVRNDQASISKARNLASAIQRERSDFKPLRDAVHNQISAAQIPRIQAYRRGLKAGPTRDRVDELIREIERLTALDDSALRKQIGQIEDARTRAELEKRLPKADAEPVAAVAKLGELMRFARRTVEEREVSAADRRRLVDLAVAAAGVVQQRGMTLLSDGGLSVEAHLRLLIAATDASYGSGLLMERERAANVADLERLVARRKATRAELKEALDRAARIVEWAQHTASYAFEEVSEPWIHLIPEITHVWDDMLRGSPLMVYAAALERLADHAAGEHRILHEIFGASVDRGVRALNPGLALGKLRISPDAGSYSRDEILALATTPADLEPAAGILTQGEGNMVSHVQLLARALGIPNAVLSPQSFDRFPAHRDKEVFYISTPGGRVIVKEASALGPQDRSVLAEYTRNERRDADGGLGRGDQRLHIDVERLDVASADVFDLASVRRKDSGIRCGPKAAFLGELKNLFPDNVARGVVVPFGAYYAHYRAAPAVVPKPLQARGLVKSGESLEAFVKRTYAAFFGEMVGDGRTERELSDWIRPRLDVVRHSIESHPLSPKLREAIQAELKRQGLLSKSDPKQTVGLFIRSDTNVEDLENFNGAGLNLTVFNRRSLDDVFSSLKAVWASPFSYRSFSWRQTLIDEPLWVLPSVVILESVSTLKSGVLVTAGIDGSDRSQMLIATSEGVGGAVDGTPAETLVWSSDGVELVSMFKSPYRRLLRPEGGSHIVASTASERVLDDREIKALVAAAKRIDQSLAPSKDRSGQARPWDIEFGFADGKLWLFQTRPFIGNDSLKNVAALAAYEKPHRGERETVRFGEIVK